MRYALSLETAVLDAAARDDTAEAYVLPRVQVFLDGRVRGRRRARRRGIA